MPPRLASKAEPIAAVFRSNPLRRSLRRLAVNVPQRDRTADHRQRLGASKPNARRAAGNNNSGSGTSQSR
jgi:hypothetical protein